MQCGYHTEIKHQNSYDSALNPISHGNPNDGNERQVEQLKRSESSAKHDPKNAKYSSRLRKRLGQMGHFHLDGVGGGQGCNLRREISANPRKDVDKEKGSQSQQRDHVDDIPAGRSGLKIGPSDGSI